MIDEHQQIRLRHPLLYLSTQTKSWISLSLQFNYAEQVAFCIIQCGLLLSTNDTAKLMGNE